VDNFTEAVLAKRVGYAPDKSLSRHILNCQREPLTEGYTIRRATKNQQISAAQAAVLAWEAAQLSIEAGALKEEVGGLYGW